MSTIPCVSCDGKGQTYCLTTVRRPGGRIGSEFGKGPCFRCEGTGRVDARTPLWIVRGKWLRRLRTNVDRDLVRAVEVLGAGLTEISKADNGRIDPEVFIDRAVAAGWDRGITP